LSNVKFYYALSLAALLLMSVCRGNAQGTEPGAWQPSSGHTQTPIWPGVAPHVQSVPGPETGSDGAVTNVTRPTMTVYAPTGKNTGAAVVVFPGGGFQMLAIDLEGYSDDWFVHPLLASTVDEEANIYAILMSLSK